ncbi:diphthine methyl ester synthase [Ixodes scapularis]|nr:diphthine methyl ester synthase [Ixodes scapularis]
MNPHDSYSPRARRALSCYLRSIRAFKSTQARTGKMLYLVGLGLGDVKDITLRGLEIVKKCSKVYLESYTSVLSAGQSQLEKFYGKELILADREMVEQGSEEMLQAAKNEDVAFLVVGDPLGATTHSDLMLRAHELGVQTRLVHNASILTAVGCCGLQLYSFGETVSIVLWTESWKPHSYYDKIAANRRRGLHTLCLLDIKMKEKTVENIIKGRDIYEPPRFMTASEAADQLLQILETKKEEGIPEGELAYSENSMCIGLARVGTETQQVVCASLRDMSSCDLGGPLHSLIVPGKLHPMELEMLKLFVVDQAWFDEVCRRSTE